MSKLKNPFSGLSEVVYAALRIMAGFLFTFHGVQKVLGLLTDPANMPPVGSELWIGGVIELVGGVLILVGFLTPYVALLCSGQMAVAYFQFHWKFEMGNSFFPVVNHGELAVLYCFVFLYIATQGGGFLSVDSLRAGSRKGKK